MGIIQVQGVHHITIVGSTRASAIDFWQGLLGMPFVMEQPNLGRPEENHLYFDPGDGRLLTVFTNEERVDAQRPAPRDTGCVEHLAFNVSRATFQLAPGRLTERGITFIQRDRGFMDSIYFSDPNGLKIELGIERIAVPGDAPSGINAELLVHQIPQGEEVVPLDDLHTALHAEVSTWRYRHGDVPPAAAADDVTDGGIEDELEARIRGHADLHVEVYAREIDRGLQ